ncbi:MAG: AMP-binding protein [Ilumatobacteraceae bacterium]
MSPRLRPWMDHLPAGTAATGLDLVGGRSLIDAWTTQWRADPGQPTLVDATSTGDGRMVSAAELDERSAAAARRLAAAGIGVGDRVLVSGATSVDYVVAYLGVLRVGAVALLVNSAYTEREVAVIAADARPALAISDQPAMAAWLDAVVPGTRATSPALEGLPPATTNEETNATIDTVGADDGALLVYTSGTTGVPKGVPLSHGNLLASAEAVRLAWQWTPQDRLALALPLYHMHGLGVGLHGTLTAGATAILFDRFDPGAVIDAVGDGVTSGHGGHAGRGGRGGRERRRATMFFGVPTMWNRLAAHPRLAELGALRLGVSGSAPLPADLHAAIAASTGRAPLERYGMSETAMLVSNPFEGERRAGSVGFPLPQVEVRLAERPGGAAEIEVRGPNVFAGYLNRPDATAACFDGIWFRTGDLGEIDDDGYLHIVGRSKELIISGGFNVFPREVEDVLRACPGVVDAAVIGVPDPEWGERVTAFVVLAPGAAGLDGAGGIDDATLAAWAADRLVGYKRPRRWERLDAIPVNAMGKVQRDVLSRLATGT